jgi:hypothetical protein
MRRLILELAAVFWLAAGCFSSVGASENDFAFKKFLNDRQWGYEVIADPTGLAPVDPIERFELRAGDCSVTPFYDDCGTGTERTEMAQVRRPRAAVSATEWYRWHLYFPKDYPDIYPARARHGQFLQHADARPAWVLEVGSTGAFWLGSAFDHEQRYFPLVDENQLKAQWHEIILRIDWSSNQGRLDAWVDGEQKTAYRGPTCSSCRVFFSYGIQRSDLTRYREHYPDRELPFQVVFFSPPEMRLTDPGWIPVETAPVEKVEPIIIPPTLIPSSIDRSDGNAEGTGRADTFTKDPELEGSGNQ